MQSANGPKAVRARDKNGLLAKARDRVRLAARDLLETVRQVVFAPREHLRLDQGNGLSAGHLRPLSLPPGIGAKCRPVSGLGSRR